MKRGILTAMAVAACSLVTAGSAYGFDCIRVSSSHQGLVASTSHGGRWLLFDFSTPSATKATLAQNAGINLTDAQAACATTAYAASGQPQWFALGIGVAGKNGVIAHNNPNDRVLSDGHGIDHFDDSPIIGALTEAAISCGIDVGGP